MKEHGKTARSRRNVPLTNRALAAIDALTARIDTPLLFLAAKAASSTWTTGAGAIGSPALDARGSWSHVRADEFLTGLERRIGRP